mgnify:CR=1 FL=1
MKGLMIFVFLFSAFSCVSKVDTEVQTPSGTIFSQDSLSLDSLWQELVFEKGGCLTGGQRAKDGHFGNEGCVLTNYRKTDWRLFFNHPKDELTEFLINKFADTTVTNIHTCPFAIATNGEVAVYCLTKIHLVNWYDFNPFHEYRDRETTGGEDCEQTWLQAILEDPKQRAVLIDAWQKL